MNETAAREVLLLQAFESVVPPSANWGADDRAWATRLAVQDGADGAPDAEEAFLVRRTRHALQRLLPREPVLARWWARRFWQPRWVAVAAIAGALFGLLADGIGSSQRINLLAPPVWTVVVWNGVVYAVLIVGAVRRALSRRLPARPGGLVRLIERLMRFGRGVPVVSADRGGEAGSAAALRRFGTHWWWTSAPLSACRAATLLHAGAAALGLGLIAGLYVRGLVLDYRADWESTFLSATSVHRALSTLLAPAQSLSGIDLPDTAGLAALRAVHGADSPGAPAAPWIHLYALTLVLAVVVPRLLLAAGSAWRARRLAARFPLPLTDPYFQRLLRQRSGDLARLFVWPYARAPAPQSIAGLRRVVAEALGDSATCELAETTPFGGEDDVDRLTAPRPAPAATLQLALFDLTATPEAEHHGAFVRALASGAPAGASTVVCVDEAAFRQRFGTTGRRLAERRDAWRRLAESLDTVALIADLAAADPAVAAADLQSAMAQPVSVPGLLWPAPGQAGWRRRSPTSR